jgi:MoaA/NifB/PqqE/SkfB family radical SAM enzyme
LSADEESVARPVRRRRALDRIRQGFREFRIIARSLMSRDRVLLAQIVPIRRCNLSCSYCTEYDKVSDPVALSKVLARIDRLAELGTGIVTIVGGEPMLHPDIDAIIRRIRERDMLAGLITNGFFLSPESVERLNDAGLEYMQISIDNIRPDEVSVKSLKSLDRKLEYLAQFAKFHVNVNAVIGPGAATVDNALQISQRADELGFSFSPGLLHDARGQTISLDRKDRQSFAKLLSKNLQLYTRINNFQSELVNGQRSHWHCLAGARYIYVCEDGLVHYCSPRRGSPGIPLERYGVEHVRAAFAAPKHCSAKCNVGCVHRASAFDNLLYKIGLRRFGSPTGQTELKPAGVRHRDGIFRHNSARLNSDEE